MKYFHKITALALSMTTSLILVGCGGGSDSSSSTELASTNTNTSISAPSSTTTSSKISQSNLSIYLTDAPAEFKQSMSPYLKYLYIGQVQMMRMMMTQTKQIPVLIVMTSG
jgi:hypothetical protein